MEEVDAAVERGTARAFMMASICLRSGWHRSGCSVPRFKSGALMVLGSSRPWACVIEPDYVAVRLDMYVCGMRGRAAGSEIHGWKNYRPNYQ